MSMHGQIQQSSFTGWMDHPDICGKQDRCHTGVAAILSLETDIINWLIVPSTWGTGEVQALVAGARMA